MERNIYKIGKELFITSNEEIKVGDWTLMFDDLGNLFLCDKPQQYLGIEKGHHLNKGLRKIILTTDQDLIKDGVQAIDDEFLEWFVRNPSCDSVLVEYNEYEFFGNKSKKWIDSHSCYKIIIPNEKPKYPIGGYAPGNYTCTCVTCKTQFKGDKRAVQCEPCAISITKEELECEHPYRFREYYNENSFKCFECNKIIVGSNIEEPKQELEKEMFELEQELDIPSHLRWHNSKPKLETIKEGGKINPLLMDEIGQFKFLPKQETTSEGFHRISKEFDYSEFDFVSFKIGTEWQQEQFSKSEFIQLVRATKSDAEARRIIREYFK